MVAILLRFEGKNPSPDSYEEIEVVTSFGAPRDARNAKPSTAKHQAADPEGSSGYHTTTGVLLCCGVSGGWLGREGMLDSFLAAAPARR